MDNKSIPKARESIDGPIKPLMHKLNELEVVGKTVTLNVTGAGHEIVLAHRAQDGELEELERCDAAGTYGLLWVPRGTHE